MPAAAGEGGSGAGVRAPGLRLPRVRKQMMAVQSSTPPSSSAIHWCRAVCTCMHLLSDWLPLVNSVSVGSANTKEQKLWLWNFDAYIFGPSWRGTAQILSTVPAVEYVLLGSGESDKM